MKWRNTLIIAAIAMLPGCAVVSVPVGLQCPVSHDLAEQCADIPVEAVAKFDTTVKKIEASPDTDLVGAVSNLTNDAYATQREYERRLAKCIRQNKALADTLRTCNENAAAFRPSLQWGRP